MSYPSQDVYYYPYISVYISETAQRTCILHVLGLALFHKYIYALLRLYWGSNQAIFRLYSGATQARLRRYYIYMLFRLYAGAINALWYTLFIYMREAWLFFHARLGAATALQRDLYSVDLDIFLPKRHIYIYIYVYM